MTVFPVSDFCALEVDLCVELFTVLANGQNCVNAQNIRRVREEDFN
jgi:hypothetical protein